MICWSILERFQTLAVGIVGFAGVIITLLVNAWIARRRRLFELRHERESLRVALVEELKINRTALQDNIKNLRSKPASPIGDFVIPADTIDEVYKSFVPRLGLLSREEVRKVMDAYLTLQTFSPTLLLIGRPDPSGRHIEVKSSHVQHLLSMVDSLMPPIEAAIEALESGLGR